MKSSHLVRAFSRRSIIQRAGTFAAGIAASSMLGVRSSFADYPDRPVKIVVANSPGGPSDLVGRLVAGALQEATGKTFIIENRGGAGSNIGMGHVARSDADGYTLLLATNAYSVNPTLYNKIPYDPLTDFVAISELASSPNTFVVRSDLPVKNIQEFIELARSSPNKFNVSTPPVGTSSQIQAEVLKIRANLPKLEAVVYKGGGEALQALLSGTVQMCSGSFPPAAPHIKAGTLRCLVVTSEDRWLDIADVPTMAEAGFKDFVFPVNTVLMAPAQTPREIVQWLEKRVLEVLDTPAMKERLYKGGFKVEPKGAQQAWARITREIAMFRDVLNQAGIAKL